MLCSLLNQRENGVKNEAKFSEYVEDATINNISKTYCMLPANTRSTISLCFSATGKTFASSHGDHTVKVISYPSGKIIRTLTGHPRTPWTVRYHPYNSNILASACLAFHVKIWNVSMGRCINSILLPSSCFSLAFHPTIDILAIATSTGMFIWNYKEEGSDPILVHTQNNRQVRCISFLSCGNYVIIGDCKPPPTDMTADTIFSLSLSLWEFDIINLSLENYSQVMRNCKLIISHAVAYNDGGFDISSDGLSLVSFVYYDDENELYNANKSTTAAINKNNINKHYENSKKEKKERERKRKKEDDYEDNNERKMDDKYSLLSPLSPRKGMDVIPFAPSILKTPVHTLLHSARLNPNDLIANDDDAKSSNPPPLINKRNDIGPMKNRYMLAIISISPSSCGKLINFNEMRRMNAKEVTCVKFSPSNRYVICGYQTKNTVAHPRKHRTLTIHQTENSLKEIKKLDDVADDVNTIAFHPFSGQGIIYGTKQGRICFLECGHDKEALNTDAANENLMDIFSFVR